ncbi:hypothetical protein FV226_18190 [Methylobacterium sp. WL12]|uniref:hypothetical protein n=1 Tax=Methylobacterium sp. WL12 TaxID=2603890 RepID=UPI0011CB8358|nr:hypothetical protein [Methylobacterium sp. WL12]TXM69723.1 hypothetical protein FV226_18190 [Methylobacterium sp. WL12]TXM93899.1 hypothetical protein FV219_19075 [Methylobacterium sp. WL122]
MKIIWFEAQFRAIIAPNEPMGDCFEAFGADLTTLKDWLRLQKTNGMVFTILPEIHDPNNMLEIIKMKFFSGNMDVSSCRKVNDDIMIFKSAWHGAPDTVWSKFGDHHAV